MLISDINLISEKLYTARKNLGLTQGEVAESAGLSDRSYADIERGNVNMRVKTLIKICDALHVTPNDILVDDMPVKYDYTELIDRINLCSPKEQETIFQILTIVLGMLNK